MTPRNHNEESLWEIWCSTEGPVEESASEEELKLLHKAMGVRPRSRSIGRILAFSLAAAAALLLVMLGEYALIKNHSRSLETVACVTSPDSKGEFFLPDGSHVWLNSSSSLTYDKSNPRLVTLEGEGFFDVRKKDGKEFVVKTGTTEVKVLGTRFNVRSSSHFEKEEVSLLSGRVEIRSGEHSVLLSPGEKAEIEAGVIAKTRADVSFDSTWTGQELDFDNVALADILTSLEHWYNVNISIAPGVRTSSRLSFKIRKESLPETQKIISRLTGCQFKMLDDKNIMISNR